ncbi:hypothetical protein OROGR_019492 [Orobanche gracilis]
MLNGNIVLSTIQNGHLPFFEGLTAKSIRWVRAVDEFSNVLKSTSLNHRQREIAISSANPVQISVDEPPFVKTSENGIVSAFGDNLVNIRHENHKAMVTITVEENVREKQNAKIGISHCQLEKLSIAPPVYCTY